MILFFTEDVKLDLKGKKRFLKKWICSVIKKYNKKCGNINFIFVSDDYLLEMNKKFLNHDYYTDVITFDYVEKNKISGDIFISLDRIKDNAKKYNVSFDDELYRVMIHGILHLLGFNDKTEQEKSQMRILENKSIELLKKLSRENRF